MNAQVGTRCSNLAAYFGPVSPNSQSIARLTATGLAGNRRYHYALEDNGVLDTALRGQLRTHPPVGQPATFVIGLASCAGATPDYPGVGAVLAPDRLSNSTVFDTIRHKALAENWLLFIHAGDRHYYDIGSEVHDTKPLVRPYVPARHGQVEVIAQRLDMYDHYTDYDSDILAF